MRERPFVRQKWLKRLRHQTAINIESDHRDASSAALSPSNTTSTPASARAPAFSSGQEDAHTPPSALTRVGREHVRSVVQLALSEARVNAFVVISSLEGLLSVAAERIGREGPVGTPSSLREVSQAGGRSEGGNKKKRIGESSQDPAANLGGRATKLYPGPGRNDSGSEDGSLRRAHRGHPTTPSSTNGSSTGRGESGAALCVRLEAVPAVLGCLEEHAGHKKIEPLAVRLLWVFASEVTAAAAIRGNPAVAAACAARMTPSDNTANASTASFLSTGQASDGGGVGDDPGYDGRKGSAGGRKTLGNATSTTEASAEKVDSNGTSAMKPLDLGGPETGSTAGDGHGSSLAVPAPPSMANLLPCLSSNTRLEEREEDASPERKSRDRAMSSAASARKSPPGSHMNVPTTDLVFVLSVAVQDSPVCQRLVLKAGGVAAMSATLQHLVSRVKQEAGSRWDGGAEDCSDRYARLAETCLRVMEYLGCVERGRRRLVRGGSVEIAISTIRCFRCHSGVLTAATGLLLLLSVSPEGRGRILKARGFRVVFEAMQRLVGNDLVQVKGAEMLQTLINEEPQARREMDSIKGGWQWLCQGTSGGDALIRYAPGKKHIPGWTVSEEERLNTEKALETAEVAASNWTPYNLATFMGTMRSQHQLQIGNLAYYHFFRVVSEAGLLPHPNEDVHDWRQRLRRYEDERHIRVGNITQRRLARDKTGAHARSLYSSSSL
ncbi:hypothetical protein Esi_0146_0065 [Ectocarpus siliculosus]|uniref:Uncharacterized protein n=1 Tax=Ectocarpus siliculosus TaxID=2880 RepID=D7FKN6_ECTSI|nr:hypothetical protein Esi_0146_0065 [Ectocarpus siliculosus]|eukprot:CBJ29436.1 hypothetical protein Esi_0146_0065 [Ectocarpus siliculosus]